MNLSNWERHIEFHPYSWYFEAQQAIINSYGLKHGDIIRVLLDGASYLCITYRRDKPKITIGGCVSLIDDSIKENSSESDESITEFSVQKLSSSFMFNSSINTISIYLPSAFQHKIINEEAVNIIKTVLHGAPYLHNIWMNISLVMVKAMVQIRHIENDNSYVLNNNQDMSNKPPFPTAKSQPQWVGSAAIKERLQYCITSPSVSHFLISGPRGSGKMTLLKDCLNKLEQFSSLVVSATDLIEGKHMCTEYSNGFTSSPISSSTSHRILSQVVDVCKQDFFLKYNDFLRELSVPWNEQSDLSLFSKKQDRVQGRSNLSSTLIDIMLKGRAYDFLIFKEFDSVFIQRSDMVSPEQRQLTSTLLMLIDGVAKNHDNMKSQCKYVGIVSDLSKIDTALRRPGRFDETVTLINPSFDIRVQFLQAILARRNCSVDQSTIDSLTKATASIPLGDINDLLTACATADQTRLVTTIQQHVQELRVQNTLEFSNEISSCRVPEPNPLESFKAISVHNNVLSKLIDIILTPILHKDLFWKLMRRRSSGNILCIGVTGSGKTFLIRRLIRQLSGRVTFFELNCAQVFSLYVGHTEKNIRKAFQEARSSMPSVLILDNYDSLAENRDAREVSGDTVASRVLATLLVELDGLSTGAFGQVTVLAITSRLDKIDKALIRPGRIDHIISVKHVPTEVIIAEQIWTEIKQFYNLSFTDVMTVKKCITDGYNCGLCITIGSIIKQCRLLASKAVPLTDVLDGLTKDMFRPEL